VVILKLSALLVHDAALLAKELASYSVFFFPLPTLSIVPPKPRFWRCKRKSIIGHNESLASEAPLKSAPLRLAFFINYY
jgi:hypothetical protein